MKTTKTILIAISLSINAFSQNADLKYAVTNTISGGLTSGITAMFDKPKGQTFTNTFIKAFYKGCIGGSINFLGKKLIDQGAFKDNYDLVYPARLLNSIGSSVIYNGARNQKMFSSLEIDLFFTRLTYRDKKVSCKIDVITLGSAIFLSLRKDMTFDMKSTLLTGALFFDQKADSIEVCREDVFKYGTQGRAIGNTIARKKCKVYDAPFTIDSMLIFGTYIIYPKVTLVPKIIDKPIVFHEIIHTFQYSNYYAFNKLSIDKFNLKYITANPNFTLLYLLFDWNGYRGNIYEREAIHFSRFE